MKKNEKRVTKKAIFASLLSLALCTSMLIGTSFAWFTDSATSAGNTIKSGRLDIEFEEYDYDAQAYKTVDGAIFNYDKWEPGYVAWKNVQVKNVGNLALKYTFTVNGTNLTSPLAEVIDVYYAPTQLLADTTQRPDFANYAAYYKGTLAQFFAGSEDTTVNDTLLPGETDQATLVLKMRETAGNEYQNLTIGEFSMSVVATQYTYEEDTFNNQYDADATFPVATSAGFAAALEGAAAGATIPVDAGNVQIPAAGIPDGITINGSDGTVFDTVNVSGANTGEFKNVTFNNIDFTSTSTANPSEGWGADWDGIISHKDTLTDVTFNNCDFVADGDDNGRVNAIYGGTVNGNVTFENCKIDADVYGANFSYVNGTLTFKNCDITGWNSFGGNKTAGGESKVVFENCTFHKSEYYGTLRFYQDGEIKNCTFDDDFVYVDCNASGKTIEITDCTGLTTAKLFNNGANANTWTIDGTDVTAQVANH